MGKILVLFSVFLFSFYTWAEPVPEIFDYISPAGPMVYEHQKVAKYHDQYLRRLLGYHPVTKDEMIISISLYLSKATGPRPLVIMVPPMAGLKIGQQKVAEQFTKRGAHVAVVTPIVNILESNIPTAEFQNAFLAAVASIRGAVDDLHKLPEVDKEKTLLWGTGIGAIFGSTAFSIDSRFKGAVLICGGGDIPGIMGKSQNSKVKAYRKARMKAEQLSEKKFKQKIKSVMEIDPSMFASRRSKDEVYMVMAALDTTILANHQYNLWKAYGKPKARIHPFAGHYGALFLSHFIEAGKYAKWLLKKVE